MFNVLKFFQELENILFTLIFFFQELENFRIISNSLILETQKLEFYLFAASIQPWISSTEGFSYPSLYFLLISPIFCCNP